METAIEIFEDIDLPPQPVQTTVIPINYDLYYGPTGPLAPRPGCVRDPKPQVLFRHHGYNTMTVGFSRGYPVIIQVRNNALVLRNDSSVLERSHVRIMPTDLILPATVEEWYAPVVEAGERCCSAALLFFLRGFLQARDADGAWYTPNNLVAAEGEKLMGTPWVIEAE